MTSILSQPRQYGKSRVQEIMKQHILNNGGKVLTVTKDGHMIEGDESQMIDITPREIKRLPDR